MLVAFNAHDDQVRQVAVHFYFLLLQRGVFGRFNCAGKHNAGGARFGGAAGDLGLGLGRPYGGEFGGEGYVLLGGGGECGAEGFGFGG